jgi:aryl-alcohol dehydrogenase-like predicted oxidoreductase
MNKRKLGQSNIEVAPLALGGNVFGWTVDESTSFALLDQFVSSGFNLIDTADVYSRWAPGNSGGESETIIGKWLKQSGKREQILIATKVGMEMGPDKKGLGKAHILKAVEDSLRRLQTDHIDLYQSHVDDANTPLSEVLEAYAELVQAGKVRVIGASNFTAPRLEQALSISRQHAYPRYESLQPEYNLVQRSGFEGELGPACIRHEVGVICYYPLAAGFLSGKYRSEKDLSKSVRGGGMMKYMNERGFRILDALGAIAAQHRSTPASVALAWVIARPGITAAIASATSTAQLTQLIEATRLQLDHASMERLNAASA